jgi:hypothetical protein
VQIVVSIAVRKLDQTEQLDNMCSSNKQNLLGAAPSIFSIMQRQNPLLQNSSIDDVQVLFSSCSTRIVHSAHPTSTPTGMPSCGTGSYEVGGGCGPCLPGYYSDVFNALRCTPCPIGYFSTGGAEECTLCPGLTTSIQLGSPDCPNYSLKAPKWTFYVIFGFLTFILVASLFFVDKSNFVSMLFMSAIPFSDVVSDLQYIVFNSFDNLAIFIACIFFFFFPMLFFSLFVFVEKKATPKPFGYDYIWLSLHDHRPKIQDEFFSWSRDKLVCWNYSLFVGLILVQGVYLILALLITMLWFLFGYFLHMCKMLSLGTYSSSPKYSCIYLLACFMYREHSEFLVQPLDGQ